MSARYYVNVSPFIKVDLFQKSKQLIYGCSTHGEFDRSYRVCPYCGSRLGSATDISQKLSIISLVRGFDGLDEVYVEAEKTLLLIPSESDFNKEVKFDSLMEVREGQATEAVSFMYEKYTDVIKALMDKSISFEVGYGIVFNCSF